MATFVVSVVSAIVAVVIYLAYYHYIHAKKHTACRVVVKRGTFIQAKNSVIVYSVPAQDGAARTPIVIRDVYQGNNDIY